MKEENRITTARNRVFETSNGPAVGKNIPNAMRTNNNYVYRITGMNQLKDILACGYVRPREGKLKGGHENEVFWSLGSDKLFFYDLSRIVLEAPSTNVRNDQIGALSLEDLSGIWQFNPEKNAFENRIAFYKKVYEEVHQNEEHKSR